MKQERRDNPSDGDVVGIGSILLLASVGYLIWCGIKYSQTNVWSWTPWRTPISVSRQLKRLEPVSPPRQDWNNGVITLIVP